MQEVMRGTGALQVLPTRLDAKRVVVLTYGGASHSDPVRRLLTTWARRAEMIHVPFSTSLLTIEQVVGLAEQLQPPQAWVSIGGGAVQDAAKCLKFLFDTRRPPQALLDDPHANRVCQTPHVAVPTTSGTGSEATCFATVYQGVTKRSLEAPWLLPDRVILDPSLTRGVPRATATYCGFDALAQAMESVWSIRCTEESMADAKEAIALIRSSLIPAVLEGHEAARAAMQEAAYLAGRAIQTTRTTLAHALSYPLSARWGLPHGLAVLLSLPRVIRYNAALTPEQCLDPRGWGHLRARMARLFEWFGVADDEALAGEVERLMGELGVSPVLADHGVGPGAIAEMLAGLEGSARAGNNPRRPEREALSRAWA